MDDVGNLSARLGRKLISTNSASEADPLPAASSHPAPGA
jgi:hypothetical protein